MSRFAPSASIDQLQRRAELLSTVRRFFGERGFWEAETPLLATETVVDRHLDPLATEAPCSLASSRCWLQTSPELGMKRLIAAGADAIFQVSRAFRRDEVGPLHNPEFTIIEWYRVGDDLWQGMQLLDDLCQATLHRGAAVRVSYTDLFLQQFDLDPHRASSGELQAAAARQNIAAPESFSAADRDAWLDLLMAERLQSQLGHEHPHIVYDYPASQAALARTRVDAEGREVAERFELYVDGVELANGYHELLDADELQQRQQLANLQRAQDGKNQLPLPNQLLAAMRHGMPACSGVALGFDRLAMIALGATSIQQVIAFPIDRM